MSRGAGEACFVHFLAYAAIRFSLAIPSGRKLAMLVVLKS